MSVRPPFPAGCVIKNMKRGSGYRAQWVYASLFGPDGSLLISATLDYINAEMAAAGIADVNPDVTIPVKNTSAETAGTVGKSAIS